MELGPSSTARERQQQIDLIDRYFERLFSFFALFYAILESQILSFSALGQYRKVESKGGKSISTIPYEIVLNKICTTERFDARRSFCFFLS